MSTDATIALADLAPDHFSALDRALCTILWSSLASRTYAQIVDALPTCDVYKDYYGWYRIDYETNVAPSAEASDIVETFSEMLDFGALHVDSKVAQSFQDASPDSRDFTLRLIQIVAIVFHDIAAYLYTEHDGGIRKSPSDFDPQVPLPKPPPGVNMPPLPEMPRRPAEFFHPYYINWTCYPRGIADVVGYWAEYQLFGGVVLFDRGLSGTEFKVAYIHPIGGHRIFKLSEAQLQECMSTLLSRSSPTHGVSDILPFEAEKHATRIDPNDPDMAHVSRGQEPREIPTPGKASCMRRAENDPHLMDAMKR